MQVCEKTKKKKNKKEKNPETLAARILEMAGAISFKFGMWTRATLQQMWFRDHQDTKV